MPNEIINNARNILNSIAVIESCRNELGYLKKQESRLTNIQRSRITELKNKINLNLSAIQNEGYNIFKIINAGNIDVANKSKVPAPPKILPKPQIVLPKPKLIPETAIIISESGKPSPEFASATFKSLSKDNKKRFIKELNINYDDLNRFVKQHKSGKKTEIKVLTKEEYSIYKPSELGELSNKIMKVYADRLVSKYPRLFEPMFKNFLTVEMELLSRSYVSMILLFTIIAFPASFLFFLALNFAFKLSILTIFFIAILCTILTMVIFYFYPASLIGGKSKKIKLELPFALVHMSAVAGSGAQPLSIFQLIADSGEYPELRKEVKKILNYVNLFGYNLSNALRNVANTTASPELKELFYGMTSTIETGGDLKDYLKEKSEDALNLYKLDRKKQVDALATYAEIYTSILIAAPLLLLVTLAIINSIGGKVGGLDVKVLAWLGIGLALPLLNIGFMLFINASQKGL